jgi:hypothetical protein
MLRLDKVIDIGPNLLAAILALTALGTAAIAAWRAEVAQRALAEQEKIITSNTSRITTIEDDHLKGG